MNENNQIIIKLMRMRSNEGIILHARRYQEELYTV
jgi:hypothetical protein